MQAVDRDARGLTIVEQTDLAVESEFGVVTTHLQPTHSAGEEKVQTFLEASGASLQRNSVPKTTASYGRLADQQRHCREHLNTSCLPKFE